MTELEAVLDKKKVAHTRSKKLSFKCFLSKILRPVGSPNVLCVDGEATSQRLALDVSKPACDAFDVCVYGNDVVPRRIEQNTIGGFWADSG